MGIFRTIRTDISRNTWQYRALTLFWIVAAILSFLWHDVTKPYEQLIYGDGFGYYVYLPEVFIHGEFNFNWFNEVYPVHYAPAFDPPTSNFLNHVSGYPVNKYFPGVAILLTPFYLISHCIALIAGYPADGFSAPYQYGVLAGAFFYAGIGLLLLVKFLSNSGISKRVSLLTALLLMAGTNLFYVVFFSPAYSHAYLFFIVAVLFYSAYRIWGDSVSKSFYPVIFIISVAFICCTRPTDLVVCLALPFVTAKPLDFFKKLPSVLKLLLRPVNIFPGLILLSVLPLTIYLQNGHLFTNPYEGEHFYWTFSHWDDILFSFRKGWFVYTPLALISFGGLLFIRPLSKGIILLFFWIVVTSVLSCWWSWTFGTTFSIRVFVDFYFITGILLGFLVSSIKAQAAKIAVTLILVPVCGLNLLQSYQHKYGIMPGDLVDREIYFRNFLRIRPALTYPVPSSTILERQAQFSPEGMIYSLDTLTRVTDKLEMIVPSLITGEWFNLIRVGCDARKKSESAEQEMVVLIKRGEEILFYNNSALQSFLNQNTFEREEYGFYIPETVRTGDQVLFYVVHTGKSGITEVRDLTIEFIRMDRSYEFTP